MKVALIIPALNEEMNIASVVEGFKTAATETIRGGVFGAFSVIVVDNGSTDRTPQNAFDAGALVVTASKRGYGHACLSGLASIDDDVDVVVFADGDGSDDPNDLAALLAPIVRDVADFVIGSRTLGGWRGMVERRALTVPQRFGNILAGAILTVGYGAATTDLGPFRAIRVRTLRLLSMDDETFGFTVQMQARAARVRCRVNEVPVHYRRRRGGKSKVSGDLIASVKAGALILKTLWKERAFEKTEREP